MNISPYADDIIKENDILVIVGKNEDLKNFEIVYAEG
jgi:trk system potassium uptake protein TrkA